MLIYGQRTKCLGVRAAVTVVVIGAQVGQEMLSHRIQHQSGQTLTLTTAEIFIFKRKNDHEVYSMTAVHAFSLDTTSVQIDWIYPDVTETNIMPNLTQVKVSEKWEISIR